MIQEEKKLLEVKFEGQEIDTFKSIIRKVSEAISQAGFNQFRLDEKESDLLKELNK